MALVGTEDDDGNVDDYAADHDDNDVGKGELLLLFPKVLVKQLRAAPFM